MRSVVVLGTTVLNGGDAALLLGELETIRLAFGDVGVTAFDQHPHVARALLPELDIRGALTWPRHTRRSGRVRRVEWATRVVRLLLAARALRAGRDGVARVLTTRDELASMAAYRDAMLVLTPAGTMLVAQYTTLPRLCDYLVASWLGRPLVLFTQTLGTFRTSLERRLARHVLRRAALVLVRGNESVQRALDLGVPTGRVRVAADPAFLLAPLDRAAEDGAGLNVAISVRDWPFFTTVRPADGQAAYEQAVGELCAALVRRHGARVTFVSTCQGVPEYWTDDADVAARIHDRLPADVAAAVSVDREAHRPEALVARYAACDLVVATRLHAAILALAGGTAAVAIAYEHKTEEVFTRLGIADWVVDIETVDGSSLVATVDRALAELPTRAAMLAAVVRAEHDAAADVAGKLREVRALPHR